MEKAPVSLLELNSLIKKTINENLASYWLTAEISELSVNYSGHCYLEFIQKDEKTERIIARARGTIWANTFRMIKPYFETTTGRTFSDGIKVMVKASIEFHEVYGLSLNILDIEPTYTVGEIALRKQKILEKLKSEGVIGMNKELELSYIPNRIAIISSKTAAGYEDFVNQLTQNPHRFRFYLNLFPAIMQGNEAESSIINQLDKIYQHSENFDAVIIIRGGGAQADLECFNSYWLAYNITQFPLPVLTGIGHEQDDSVVDMVAHTRLKTPTAVAEFLIDCMSAVANELQEVEEAIVDAARNIIVDNKSVLKDNAYRLNKEVGSIILKRNKQLTATFSSFISSTKNNLSRQRITLARSQVYLEQNKKYFISTKRKNLHAETFRLKHEIKYCLSNKKHSVESLNQFVELNNPLHILEKGYSITTLNRKVVKDSVDLKPGDEIETKFFKGKTTSKIQ
jgi:exodeoxyribonuclease VII large subunit